MSRLNLLDDRMVMPYGSVGPTVSEAAIRAVSTMYPCLTPAEALRVVEIEAQYPWWHVFPAVGYPYKRLWYARRMNTSPPALVRADELEKLPARIEQWLADRSWIWGFPISLGSL